MNCSGRSMGIYIYIYVPCDMGPRFGQFLRKDIGLIDLYV